MKYLKIFEDYQNKTDTRIVNDVKATEVVDYFDRNVDNADAQFIDFDTVELIVHDTEDMTQDEIDEILDGMENTIFNAHLTI